MDLGGAQVSVRPLAELTATLTAEERPRCASTPCSPIRGTLGGYQILHMDSNYLVGFTTGEELLKLAHTWSEGPTDKGLSSEAGPRPPQDASVHRPSRTSKAKSRSYQPYDIPAANGRRRRRMPSSGDGVLRAAAPGGPHTPLPLCLLNGKRTQSRSLDYLNLDKISLRESPDTEVLQHQLQHLTLRGERVFSRNKT